MKRFFLSLILLLIVANAHAATYYVATTGNDTHAGTQVAPFLTLQKGLNTAVNGDTVLVANGTYTGAGNKNLTFGGKTITLQSQGGRANCIIDCQNSGRAMLFSSGETAGTILNGFTLTNSRANESGGCLVIANASPTIQNCTIQRSECIADPLIGGSGVLIHGGSPTFSNCLITECEVAGIQGGGLGGGVLVLSGEPTFLACTFLKNKASSFLNGAFGGAIAVANSTSLVVMTGCSLYDNLASTSGSDAYGGGISLSNGGRAVLTNCLLVRNRADGYYDGFGGGVWANGANTSLRMTHCVLTKSRAEGFRISSQGFGGAILTANQANVILENGIIWDNYAETAGASAYLLDGGLLTVNYSVSPPRFGWVGNIQSDPQFVRAPSPGTDGNWGTADDDYGDLHLQPTSPCINLASASVTGILPYDKDGNTRTIGSAPDMGAYERNSSAYYGITTSLYVDKAAGSDITGNGTQAAPFQTVTRALNAVANPVYGVAGIFIKAGNYGTDRPRVTKKVKFVNWGNTGLSRIGKP